MNKKPKSFYSCYPKRPCKLDCDKDCFGNYNNCSNCSKNPHRFDDRKITKGQIIFLMSRGYDVIDLATWSYLKACREIERLK